ncbi:hypothetical protein BC629DRAFT_1100491 [Irpex lacteus]|nr:hypothetical protein BC629DRAFT_1100491 [Irpex lacteus]
MLKMETSIFDCAMMRLIGSGKNKCTSAPSYVSPPATEPLRNGLPGFIHSMANALKRRYARSSKFPVGRSSTLREVTARYISVVLEVVVTSFEYEDVRLSTLERAYPASRPPEDVSTSSRRVRYYPQKSLTSATNTSPTMLLVALGRFGRSPRSKTIERSSTRYGASFYPAKNPSIPKAVRAVS